MKTQIWTKEHFAFRIVFGESIANIHCS